MPDQSTAPGDAIGIGLDADLGRVWFAKNNTWIGAGNPAAGTNAAYTYVPGTVGAVFPAVGGTLALIRWTLRSVLAEFAFTPPSGFAPGG